MSNNSILLVEDDTLLCESLTDMLEEEGYSVSSAVNGEEALELTFHNRYDLYILDINLPLLDGLTLLRELRQAGDETPAIFLTSHSKAEKLKEGFLSGGDDYITKPFENEELLLRIHALLRRFLAKVPSSVGEFLIDTDAMQISYKNTPLQLSKTEYNLLLCLLRHAGKPVSKEQIIEEVWHDASSGSDGVIRVYINRLKQYIPDVSIENIRGIGYKLVC